MKNKIILAIFVASIMAILSSVSAVDLKIYVANIGIDNNYSIWLNSFSAKSALYIDSASPSDFVLLLFSEQNTLLYKTYFDPSFIILSEPAEETNITYISLNLPFFPDAKYLKVYYKDELKLEQDVASLICNNNSICENNAAGNENMSENYISCPSDCKWYDNDSLCNSDSGDNFCDYDCYNDSDCYIDNCNDGSINGNTSICEQGSCYDNIQNGNEQGVDCGGRCWNACPICGNEVLSGDEGCEENISIDLTCENFGFDAGTLSCNNCKFDTSLCLIRERACTTPYGPCRCGDNICQQISASPPGFFARIWSWILALFGKKILASPIYSEDCNSCPQDCGSCSFGDDSGDDSGGGGDDAGGTYVPINSVNNITSNQTTRNLSTNFSNVSGSRNYTGNSNNKIIENPKNIKANYISYIIPLAFILIVIIALTMIRKKRRRNKK